jgi:hypothetical protein
MLGVAALASRPRPPSVQEEATLSRKLRTSRSPRDARPGRILRAAPQVMSLRREHDSNSDSIVSHPSMSMAVKPHQAFLVAARTFHVAGLVPISSRVPAFFQSVTQARLAGPLSGGRSDSGRLTCVSVRAPGPNDRLSVWNRPRSQHLLPCTRRASGTSSIRAHPSNERCLRRFTRRHNGGSFRPRLLHPSGGDHASLCPRQFRFCPGHADTDYTSTAAAFAWRRAVELTRSFQSFSSAPSGASPSFR